MVPKLTQKKLVAIALRHERRKAAIREIVGQGKDGLNYRGWYQDTETLLAFAAANLPSNR